METNIKKLLLDIELALKNEDFDGALDLYEFIEKNWEYLSKNLTLKEGKEALKILNFISNLLKEKISSLREDRAYLTLRQNYTKYL